jgi:16S rRNA (adenine1518-N6/adenine1519-N6)-dimethyltransferase
LRARKRFGQHFLEPAWVAKLVDALDAHPDDTFLEIGPGRGALTVPLAAKVKQVVAVELDRDLAAALPEKIPDIQLLQADFLDVDLTHLLRNCPKPVRVVGNLPYNVASPILFKLLHDADDGRRLADATLMLQKEVADRLVAKPGADGYGALAIQVALLADAERILSLPPGAFRPPPNVRSAVVRLRFRSPRVDVGDRAVFEKLVRSLFLQRRKTLANALKPLADGAGRSVAELIEQAQVDAGKRPEALTLEHFARLARAML